MMDQRMTLSPNEIEKINAALSEANRAFIQHYPGESNRRQAVHTVYGGAHLFRADSARRLGEVALRSLEEYAPDSATLADALGVTGGAHLWETIYQRIIEKLRREPVEDFRLDFEDGYGNRADDEEDGHAASAAAEVARGLTESSLPPFIGLRIKPLNEDLRARSVRTLDIFVSALTKATGGKLPPNFVITVPKVQLPAQMTAAVGLFALLEKSIGLTNGALRIEPMIETPQAIINQRGEVALGSLWRRRKAAAGACTSAFTITPRVAVSRRLPNDGTSGLRFCAPDDARLACRHRRPSLRRCDQHFAGRSASRERRPAAHRGGEEEQS